jgi:hypothetical protein
MRVAMVAQWLRASRSAGPSRRATQINAGGIAVVQGTRPPSPEAASPGPSRRQGAGGRRHRAGSQRAIGSTGQGSQRHRAGSQRHRAGSRQAIGSGDPVVVGRPGRVSVAVAAVRGTSGRWRAPAPPALTGGRSDAVAAAGPAACWPAPRVIGAFAVADVAFVLLTATCFLLLFLALRGMERL